MSPNKPHELCGANKKSGGTCRSRPMPNGRCDKHGGLTPRGIASANFKHGRYSMATGAVAARYQAALGDTAYLELTHEVALLEARMGERLAALSDHESGSAMKQIKHAWEAFMNAGGIDTPGADTAAAFEQLGAAIAGGWSDVEAWTEIRALIQERRKLAAQETKRILVGQKHLNAAEAMALAHRLGEAVKRHVNDDDTLRAIAREFEALVREAPGPAR